LVLINFQLTGFNPLAYEYEVLKLDALVDLVALPAFFHRAFRRVFWVLDLV
jgi:hypothetical protein